MIFNKMLWFRKGKNIRGVGTMRGLKRNQAVTTGRLCDSKNFVGERQKLLLNTFSYIKPVERSENGSDNCRSGSLSREF